MSVFEIVSAFSLYGADVVALSLATAILTQVLKKTVLKNAQQKVLTFLPFVIGTVLYAVFTCVYQWSFAYVIDNYVKIFEHGFAVGALATFFYVLYEQFLRKENKLSTKENVIAALIDGYVEEDKLEATAKAIAEAVANDVTGTGASKIEEIILQSCGESVSEQDIRLLSQLILETLARVTTL